MDDKTFDNLFEFSRKLSFPQALSSEQIIRGIGNGFRKDNRLKGIVSVVSARLSNANKPTHRFASRENFVNCGKKLTAQLNNTERFYFFVLLMHGGVYDSALNTEEVEIIAEILDINAPELNSLQIFFNQDTPFKDLCNTIYSTPENSNPLIRAKGVNTIFSLKQENEIHYLKFIPQRNLFLLKVFSLYRPNNSITQIISVQNINIIDSSTKLSGFDYSYESLQKSLEKFMPFQSVKCKAENNTPAINLDATLSKIQIKGSSSPLSPLNYFQPILDWIELYRRFGAEALDVEIELEYFNSYTLKFLLNLCIACKALSDGGKEITIKWFYDDEENFEFGQQLRAIFGEKLELIKIPKNAEITL